LVNENGSWKDHTDIWCTWCVHPFDTVPIGLPEKYCQKTGKYYVRECFCSFNCAHAYNLSLRDEKIWERLALLMRIKREVYKNTELENKPINYAPPLQMLTVFGGSKTLEQFRNNNISIPKEYIKLVPPLMPFLTVIEELPKYFNSSISDSGPIYNKIKKARTPHNIKKNNVMDLLVQ